MDAAVHDVKPLPQDVHLTARGAGEILRAQRVIHYRDLLACGSHEVIELFGLDVQHAEQELELAFLAGFRGAQLMFELDAFGNIADRDEDARDLRVFDDAPEREVQEARRVAAFRIREVDLDLRQRVDLQHGALFLRLVKQQREVVFRRVEHPLGEQPLQNVEQVESGEVRHAEDLLEFARVLAGDAVRGVDQEQSLGDRLHDHVGAGLRLGQEARAVFSVLVALFEALGVEYDGALALPDAPQQARDDAQECEHREAGHQAARA